MGDVGEDWKAYKPVMKANSQRKRARNRKEGESALFLARIPFLKKNGGAHLIVYPEDGTRRVDYWPGTGLWRSYWGSHEGRGISSLMAHLNRGKG